MSSNISINFCLNEQKIIKVMFIALVATEIFLVLLDVIVNYGKLTEIGALRRMSNIAREDGIGTWFASTQTLFAGLTAMLIYVLSKRLGKQKRDYIGWLVIALFFMFMAVDDAAQIHERVGTAFKTIAKREDGILFAILSLSPSYAWQLIFIPIFGAIGVYMSFFLWRQLRESGSRKLILLALLWMGIAVVLDFFEGLDKKHAWNIYTYLAQEYELRNYTVWHFAKVIEEFLEMLSITTFWIIFCKQLFFTMQSTEVMIKADR